MSERDPLKPVKISEMMPADKGVPVWIVLGTYSHGTVILSVSLNKRRAEEELGFERAKHRRRYPRSRKDPFHIEQWRAYGEPEGGYGAT